MESDLWRQWQTIAAQFASLGQGAAHAAQGSQARETPSGPAPFIESAERFAAEARAFIEGTANASASSMVDAARKFGDFLRDQAAGRPAAVGRGVRHRQSDRGRCGGAVGLAGARAPPANISSARSAWRKPGAASMRRSAACSACGPTRLREAAASFAARLGTARPGAPSAEALQKLYDTWIDCAEDAYARMAHSEAFCGALADYVNASSQWRDEMQASRRAVGEDARSADPQRDQYAHAAADSPWKSGCAPLSRSTGLESERRPPEAKPRAASDESRREPAPVRTPQGENMNDADAHAGLRRGRAGGRRLLGKRPPSGSRARSRCIATGRSRGRRGACRC